jgi:hypothetical protein
VKEDDNGHLSYQFIKITAAAPMCLEDRTDLLGGVITLAGKTEEGRPCSLIPYYASDNRTQGFMQVWLQEAESRSLYSFYSTILGGNADEHATINSAYGV